MNNTVLLHRIKKVKTGGNTHLIRNLILIKFAALESIQRSNDINNYDTLHFFRVFNNF